MSGIRLIKQGEMLALEPGEIHRGADGFFWIVAPGAEPNSRHKTYDDVAIVHVRGSLEHHSGSSSDNYEDILARVDSALYGRDCCEEGSDPIKPAAVLMCIDSRGGVVAGLNETVAAIQRCKKESGVRLVAYINEMAASAAYALACACDEIVCPASAILGSIGTISMMISTAEKDAADGIDVRIITSGARKADGHPHAPISDAAVEAERGRVEELADTFFRIAGKSRGVSPDKLRSLQAAIFLGPDAEKRGLADAVASLNDLAMTLSKKGSGTGVSEKGNETDRQASLDNSVPRASVSDVAQVGTTPEVAMLALEVLIKKTEAALAGATVPAKKEKFARRLAAYKLAAARCEKPDHDGDEDDDEDEDDDDESKSKKAAAAAEKAKKKAEASKHRAKAAEYKQKAAESEEEAKKAEEDDDEEEEEAEEAAAALAVQAGMSPGAAAAVASQAKALPGVMARLEKLEKVGTDRERAAMIAEAKGARRITPTEAKTLASKPMSFVRDFLEMRPSAVVFSDDSETLVPDGREGAVLGSDVLASIDLAVASFEGSDEKKAALKVKLIEDNKKQLAQRANGAAGRH